MKAITEFQGPYRWLSNFWPAPVTLDGVTYPTVEHAYQAAKTFLKHEREAIRQVSNPGQAKRLGKTAAKRPDWEDVKEGIMRELLRQKFAIPELRAKLLATGDAELVEGNYWSDREWGRIKDPSGNYTIGKNLLGKLLMEIREALRSQRA